MRVYQACVLSTLLCGSESWTTYMCQERRLNTFHMRCLKRIRGSPGRTVHIGPCQDPQHVFTAEPETPALVGPCTAHGGRPLAERHPLWTTHLWREASGTPARFKDAGNRDIKACDNSPKGWEAVAEDRNAWRQATRRGIERAYEKKHKHATEKRMRRQKKQHYHHCHPVSSALAAARIATQESAFTARVDSAKI